MGRIVLRTVTAALALGTVLAATAGEARAYLGAKAGVFVPNGKERGLDGFDTGYGGELFFGGDLGPVAVELGLGGYRAEPEASAGDALEAAYVGVTGKLSLPLGPLSFYGGAGGASYFARFGDDVDATGTGVHLVGGAEFSVGLVGVLAELRWNRAELDFGGGDADVGGLLFSLGIVF